MTSIAPVLDQVESRVKMAEERVLAHKLKHDLEEKFNNKQSKHILVMNERVQAAESWCLGLEDRKVEMDNAAIQRMERKTKEPS